MQQQRSRECSPPRMLEEPQKYKKERLWFSSQYLRPRGFPIHPNEESLITSYTETIWQRPTRDMIVEYGSSIDEMSALCGEGPDGWLLSSHVDWLLTQANKQQHDTVCLCIPAITSTLPTISHLVRKFVFVANVGKNAEGETFFASLGRPGCHWVLIIMDIGATPDIFYCDSLGWNCPVNIIQYLECYAKAAGLSLTNCKVRLAHSQKTDNTHICDSTLCYNFPVQRCGNVCGIVASVFGVIYALDNTKFFELTQAGNIEKNFLHEPTKYERYLRRVLICWFMSRRINLDMLFPLQYSFKINTKDHTYARPPYKRKHTDTFVKKIETESVKASVVNSSMPNSHFLNKEDVISEKLRKSMSQTKTTDLESSNIETKNINIKKKVKCPICQATFSCKQALCKHKKTKHAQVTSRKAYTQCTECHHFTAATIQDLIKHMQTKHQKVMTIQIKKFPSDIEFEQWKRKTEKESNTKFIKSRGVKINNSFSKVSYYCHRSGKVRSRKDSKKCKKLQGSSKIGHKCTAFMTVRTMSDRKMLEVEYCLEHSGHSFDLAHLPLSDDLRKKIAGKLSQGIEPGRILNDIRDEIVEVNRDSLVTRKDIHNIKQQYNISLTQKHKLDGTSVDIWVQDLKRRLDNPVIFYKAQNSQHSYLKDEDFLLCLQTDFQRGMTIKYGHKIIFTDSTHNTTHYDFYLTSILVLDDFEEGIPVAWSISNREDSEILELFMQALKESCGQDIIAEYFMSDLANNAFNAWCSVFSKPIKRLYCSWHVDKSWRKNILELVKIKEDQCNTYAFLKILQMETNENLFRQKLQNFFNYLTEYSPKFLNYFHKNYVSEGKVKFWAGCFRIGSLANTNMFAEAFHRVLKEIYFNKKQNRRVDYLLVILLKLARDKAIEQLIKLEKGKITHRIKEIRARHKNSENVKNIQSKNLEDREWVVASSTTNDMFYTVQKILNDPCSCKLVCDLCNVCVHMYTCTCTDFLLKAISCKHIHAVHSIASENISPSYLKEVEHESTYFLKSILTQDKPDHCQDTKALKIKIMRKMNEIMEIIGDQTATLNTLQELYKCLNNACSIVYGLKEIKTEQQFDKKHQFPSNKNHETQRRLFSTKRKPKKKESKLKLKKPDRETIQNVTMTMRSSAHLSFICALCFCEDDQTGEEETKWFECLSCGCVTHISCNLQINDGCEADCMKCVMCR